MNISAVMIYLTSWGLLGAALFSLFAVFLFRSGLVFIAREEDGTLNEHIPVSGRILMLGTMVSFLAFFAAANYFGLIRPGYSLSFKEFFVLNFALYLILFLYDTFVVDAFVLGYWRPSFLRVPEAMGRASMKKHIVKSLPMGTAFGAVLAAAIAAVSIWVTAE